ncbi:MAG TPA: hypothetical protein PKD64_03215 [Pirellulaceae bacterium]|nr:hypothetical protein [Pirellulaceae bacterium]HMO91180.1 hypothetical protein [Pirellulaceae bacterium]HMP69050.1 hypothetical protein [Pirellulaceae bacterium]
MNRLYHVSALILLMVVISTPSKTTAHEFRVETEIVRQGETTPISNSLTLSESGIIYDFLLAKPGSNSNIFADEIAIYDTKEKKFILINVTRRIRTTVYDYQIARLLTALKSNGVIKDDFLVNPVFEESYDLSSNWLTLTSPRLTYRARGSKPQDGTRLPVFNVYLDQFSRLKATEPRGMPPFARLELNQAIKRYGFIPEEIHLTLSTGDDDESKTLQLTSRHNVLWQLSKQDREHIELAKKYWITFEEVDLNRYRNLNTTANSKQ